MCNLEGQCIECIKHERPLYPVRLALSSEGIDNAIHSGITYKSDLLYSRESYQGKSHQELLDDSNADRSYNLRRMRSGYLYIYAPLGHHTEEEGMPEVFWRIFQYTDDPALHASPLFEEILDVSKMPCNSRKKNVPYPSVNMDVSVIHYIYSEWPLPVSLLKKIKEKKPLRDSLMHIANFQEETGDYNIPFSKRKIHIPDFIGMRQERDIADSERRLTNIGYHEKYDWNLLPPCEEKARCIGLIDNIGNAKDIGYYHGLVWAEDIAERKNHLYAITTAKAVSIIEKQMGEKWKQDREHPITIRNYGSYEDMASEDPFNNETKMENLAKAQLSLLTCEDEYSIQTTQQILCEMLPKYSKNWNSETLLTDPKEKKILEKEIKTYFSDKNAVDILEIFNYTSEYSVAAMWGMDTSPKGVAEQSTMLEKGAWYENVCSVLNAGMLLKLVAAGVGESMLAKKINLNVYIAGVASAHFKLWARDKHGVPISGFQNSQLIHKEKITCASIEEASKVLKDNLREFTTKARNPQLQVGAVGRAVVSRKTHKVCSVLVSVSAELTSGELKLEDRLKVAQSVGQIFAIFILLANIKEWEESNYKSGALLVKDSLILISQFDETSLIKKGRVALSQATKTEASQIKRLMDSKSKVRAVTIQKAEIGLKNHLIYAARSANVIGLGISFFQSYQAFCKGDKVSIVSNAVFAAAEIPFFIATFSAVAVGSTLAWTGFGVVLVLIAIYIGTLAEDKYTAWVRQGFWGDSPKYWEESRSAYGKQLENSLALVNESDSIHSAIKKYFEKEMQDFYNIIWGIRIVPADGNDKIIDLYCPAFKNKLYLKVRIDKTNKVFSHRGRGRAFASSAELKFDKNKLIYVESGHLRLDLSSIKELKTLHREIDENKISMSSSIVTVTVKQPHLGEDLASIWGFLDTDSLELIDYFKNTITYIP